MKKSILLNFLSETKKAVLTVLGDIRIYPYPLYFLYHPKGYKIKGDKFEKIAANIQTFDVLLRRYDTYLDKVFIPGYWNHAAICSHGQGPFSRILHATSEGVHEDTLFDFMKTDHVCLLRPRFNFDASEVRRKMEAICGSPYDFDFNFGDPSAFSCTEVIKYLYNEYNSGITTTQFLGKTIVPPDNIFNASGFVKIVI
ncbi:MAG: hypothetical protein Kow0029_01710 [Candidatus Rifleibacteriota bacterium]